MILVKKLIAVAVALAAGAFIFSKVRASRENDLWHEATNN
ncbi:MAG TPA: DLW-39 family protein [Pseudonocardia sp.]|nr:DLW-39 family protein [Pseudonocardia sp.]HLU57152.1 DLW-39 family protein [Pseudonocardia sp.]